MIPLIIPGEFTKDKIEYIQQYYDNALLFGMSEYNVPMEQDKN